MNYRPLVFVSAVALSLGGAAIAQQQQPDWDAIQITATEILGVGVALVVGLGIDFAVESYLEYQGERFLSRFDALSYLYLTRVMDYFDPFADARALDTLKADPVRFLLVSFTSDWRFSTEHTRRIVRHLEEARIPTSFREIQSTWGHDSFLLDLPDYHATVRAYLDKAAEEIA